MLTKDVNIRCDTEKEFTLLMDWYEIERDWMWRDLIFPSEGIYRWQLHAHKEGALFIPFKDLFFINNQPNANGIVIPFSIFNRIYGLEQWKCSVKRFPTC
jgi:hypothetical protein